MLGFLSKIKLTEICVVFTATKLQYSEGGDDVYMQEIYWYHKMAFICGHISTETKKKKNQN
jgi:hypothetical protein